MFGTTTSNESNKDRMYNIFYLNVICNIINVDNVGAGVCQIK